MSSITDHGTGDFSITFSDAMGNQYYTVAATATKVNNFSYTVTPAAITTSAARIGTYTGESSNTKVDTNHVMCQIFGD